MATRAPRLQAADLVTALRASLWPRGRPAGAGWYTPDELARELGVKRAVAVREAKQWEKCGKAECARGTFPDPAGIERRCRYYRLKGAK